MRDLSQLNIANKMSVGIVDRFELIHIDYQN